MAEQQDVGAGADNSLTAHLQLFDKTRARLLRDFGRKHDHPPLGDDVQWIMSGAAAAVTLSAMDTMIRDGRVFTPEFYAQLIDARDTVIRSSAALGIPVYLAGQEHP